VHRPNSEDPAGTGEGLDPSPPSPVVDGPSLRDEFALIARLQGLFEATGGPLGAGDLGIGDDAAAVTLVDPGRVVLATDLVVEGVHVDLAVSSPEDVGWKSLMVTVSDLAAMGARASYVLLSVVAPGGVPVARVGEGVADAAVEAGCTVIGGDLSVGPVLVVSMTAVGSVPDDGAPMLRRDGAHPGDRLFVTGPCGGSAAGLRLSRETSDGSCTVGEPAALAAHRRPAARLMEGTVARRSGVSAAIDVSDGLVADLVHMAGASGVGFDLEPTDAVIVAGATLNEALHGGEDYELVLATPDPGRLMEAFRAAGLRQPLAIGRCTEHAGLFTLEGRPLGTGGWRHQF
jgi:thiamine-monophosphate kinase